MTRVAATQEARKKGLQDRTAGASNTRPVVGERASILTVNKTNSQSNIQVGANWIHSQQTTTLTDGNLVLEMEAGTSFIVTS